MQKAQQVPALQVVLGLPRTVRRESAQPEESQSQQAQPGESEPSAMGKVLEMAKPELRTPEVMYLFGSTLLRAAKLSNRVIFDTDGTPVLEGEFYEVTSKGIKRVA